MPGENEQYVIPLAIDLNNIVNRVQPAVTGLNQINQAANAATQNMRRGFTEAGTAADNVGRRVAAATGQLEAQGRSINSLKQQMASYQAIADKANDPKRIVEYNRKVQELQDQINKLSNAGRRGFDELGNRIEENTKKVGLFQGALTRIATYLTVAFAVRELINFGKEVVQVSAKTEGVERAFNRINAPGLLDQLRKATRGAVSDLDLMQKAVLANQFDIPIRQLASFYEFASKRARDLGKDTDKFVNDVIAGTARGSVRILDNLGISQSEVRAEVKKTGDFAQAVFNVVERQLAKTQAESDLTGDKLSRLSATVTNIEGNIGKSSKGIISGIVDLVQIQLNLINDFVIGLDGKLTALGQKFALQDNSKLIDAFKNDSPEGRASSLKGYDSMIAKQEQVVNNINQKQQKLSNDLNIVQKIGRAAFTDLNENLDKERASAIVYLEELKGEKQSLLGVADEEAQSAKKAAALADANAAKAAARNAKVASERKALNDKLTQLTNDYYSAEVEAIDDATTKAVAREEVNSTNRVRSLENDKQSLLERSKAFPELADKYRKVIAQINRDIEQEQTQSSARVAVIIKKGDDDQLELRRQSAKDIASLLKSDTDAQVTAINERYDKVRDAAKKAGTLTPAVEKQLAVQQAKDVNTAITKQMDDNLKKQEEIALSAIYARKKKEGESEKKFERDNQIAILQIQIEFAIARRNLIQSDPDKIKEVNDLTAAILKAQKALKGLKSEGQKDLFDALGIDGDKVKEYAKGISTVGAQFASLFSNLADAADQRIDKIKQQMDAVDDLISKDQDAVDKEQDLANEGRANNLTSAKQKLEDDKKQKAILQKQEEDAQKKKQSLQQAAIVADTFAQTSSLITAASEIFEALAGIPFVGVPLAVATIGVMFGAFAAAKINAFNATKQTAAEGAIVGGKSHGEGGNKYYSMDGNDTHVLEIERGERIIKKSSAAKHSSLLDAANKDDFSNVALSDISIQQLLRQTGVMTQLEAAKKAGDYNNQLQERQNNIVVQVGSNTSGRSEDLLQSINKNILNLNKSKDEEVFDMDTYIWIRGNGYSNKIYK